MASIVSWQTTSPEQLLTERFHITNGFHPGQREIIERLVQGQRVLAIQRTGWGKSLCYQMASLYYPHLTIVFSPLKALMRDQCQRCNTAYNIPAAIVSSDFTLEENEATLKQAVAGAYKILFIAPERLSNALWQTYVPQMRISMIVIDEAHCISTWGHDFRPQYRRIVRLINALPDNIPVLALTATANKRVEEDILQQVGSKAQIIRGTMQRPNLHLNVVALQGDREKLGYLGELLSQWSDKGIIYTATQSSTEMIATFLAHVGINAAYYHAGLEDTVRQDVEKNFMANQYQVVCSTNALGMGIDKRDVRFVIHYHVPASPINYYQEMGRAGRDGEAARCILLYDPADLTIQEHFIRSAKPDGKCYATVLALLRANPQGLREQEILRTTGYSQGAVRNIFSDLEDQGLIKRDAKQPVHYALPRSGQASFTEYDLVREQKERELQDIKNYAQTQACYAGYLTTYLGDPPEYNCGTCGNCQSLAFPKVTLSERILLTAERFLTKDFLPRIEKRGTIRLPAHEAGWSLSYHGGSHIGELVRLSKYKGGDPFAEELVTLAVELLRQRYPVNFIDAIVSVPPTKSGTLVEIFAKTIAKRLGIPYVSAIAKVRSTGEQKNFTNRVQKSDNVKGAFALPSPNQVAGRTLLLIDDIYDSGQTIREVGQTLMKAGAKAVYPFTITRTAHSDDQ